VLFARPSPRELAHAAIAYRRPVGNLGDFARFPGLRWRHPLAAAR
jgi:hypothetical protein